MWTSKARFTPTAAAAPARKAAAKTVLALGRCSVVVLGFFGPLLLITLPCEPKEFLFTRTLEIQ